MDAKFTAQDARISNLETRMAVAERDIEGINKKLDKIDTNLSRLVWLVLAAIIGAVLKSSLGW